MLICYHFPQFLGLSLINPSLPRGDVIKRLTRRWMPELIQGERGKTLSSLEREPFRLPLWVRYAGEAKASVELRWRSLISPPNWVVFTGQVKEGSHYGTIVCQLLYGLLQGSHVWPLGSSIRHIYPSVCNKNEAHVSSSDRISMYKYMDNMQIRCCIVYHEIKGENIKS